MCDIGGDVFNFLMQDEGLTFPETPRKLADRAGITLAKAPDGKRRSGDSADIKAELFRALSWAQDLFHRYLLEDAAAAAAREYLANVRLGNFRHSDIWRGTCPVGLVNIA